MNKEIDELKNKINVISEKGWIRNKYKGTGSAGMLFEELIGKQADSFPIPDYYGIEIKTKYSKKNPYINLFTAGPDSYLFEIERICDNYGYPDKDFKQFKVFNTSIYGNRVTVISDSFLFKILVNYEKKQLVMTVFNRDGKILDRQTRWSFEMLEEKLVRKMDYLALINVETRYIHGEKYFRYLNAEIYKLKGFNEFINLIETGKIKISFKISIFKSGKNFGKIHNHGTSFEIDKDALDELFFKLS